MTRRLASHIRSLSAALFCFVVFTEHSALAAEEAIHGGGEEHKSAGLPQLDVSTFPSQLFWLGVTFAILYFYFSRKALPDISGVLENRGAHIKGNIDAADKLKSEAAQAQETYENLLSGARTEATRLMNDTAAGIKTQAEKEAQAFRDRTTQDIQSLEKKLDEGRRAALQDMNRIAAEIASEAAARIAGINTDLKQAQTVVQALNKREAA